MPARFAPLAPRARWCLHPLPVLAGLAIACAAAAQPGGGGKAGEPEAPTPAQLPDASPSLLRLLEAPYLTEEEQKDLRIFHGRWRESDLDTPARAARAALIRGDYLDPSFDAEGVDPLDRAEARLLAGRPAEAIREIERAGAAAEKPRAAMLLAQAAEMLGRFDDAVAAIDGALGHGQLTSPEDIVCGVRMLAQRIHLRGTDEKAALEARSAKGGPLPVLKADANAYHQMIETLGRARLDTGNGLYWPALLAEAEILSAHDKPDDTQAALGKLLELNPACARAWAILGGMSVDAFNFEATEAIALRLDALAGNPSLWTSCGDDAAREPETAPTAHESIDAAIIRARAALRQIEGARAAEILDPLLAKYPTHPALLAVRAAAEATRFEFEAMKARLAEFDTLYPGSPAALYQAGRALSESRQYAKSAEMLQAAAARLPSDPQALGELGLMYVQWGKNDLALEALERAYALDPFNLRVDNTLQLVRELLTYSELESEHFIVRFKPGVDEVFARDILGPMEENHRLVTGNGPGGLDHQPFGGNGKTVIDLMGNHREFGVRIAGMPAIHTIAASTGPLIAMEAPREGPNHNGTYDWKRVLRHEYTHTVNLDRTNNRIPHWFTEANAVYLELAPRDYSACVLLRDAFEADAFFDFVEINTAFVRPKKPSDRSQGYAQGHLMYEYIITRWGNRAPLDLMDRYAVGIREEQAFTEVLGIGRERFMAEFKPWARAQMVVWGLLPREGTPSVKELVERHAAAAAPPDGSAPAHDAPEPGDQGQAVAEAEADPLGDPALVRAWLEQHPGHPDLLELVLDAELRSNGGRATAELVPLIERYASARPVDPKPHRLMAQMLLASEDAQERFRAIEHLEYLDAREQKTTAYATELARLYFARAGEGDLERARVKAERATQIAPYVAPPRELAAAIAIKARDFDSAERHIVALTRLEPDREIHAQRLEALRRMRATEAK